MSWPAVFANGPSCPHPVILPKISLEFLSKHSVGPIPNFSITPGLKPSISASALSNSLKKISLPFSLFKFSLIDFLFLPVISSLEGGPGISVSNLSILITSAPRSARSMPASGPGPIPDTSMILYPVNGPIKFKDQIFL